MSNWVVTIDGTMDGVDVNNILGFKCDDPTDETTALAVAIVFETAWQENICTQVTDDYVMERVTARDLFGTSIADFPTGVAGSSAVAPTPPLLVASVQFRTGLQGLRGGTGLSGLSVETIDPAAANQLTSAARGALIEAFQAFQVDVESDAGVTNGQLMVTSRWNNRIKRNPPLQFPVTSISVGPRFGTRRSRIR